MGSATGGVSASFGSREETMDADALKISKRFASPLRWLKNFELVLKVEY